MLSINHNVIGQNAENCLLQESIKFKISDGRRCSKLYKKRSSAYVTEELHICFQIIHIKIYIDL